LRSGADVLLKIIEHSEPLEKIAAIWGASTVAEGSEYPHLLIDKGPLKLKPEIARFVVSGTVCRYATTWETERVQFMHKNYSQPVIRLHSPMPERRSEQARQPKIIISKVALEPRAFPDIEGEFLGAYTTYVFPEKISLLALTAIINSHLMRFIYRLLYDALAMGGGYLRFQPPQVRRMPICNFDLSKNADKSKHDQIIGLVEQMLAAKKVLAKSQTDKDKSYYENKCATLDRQIDRLVYELYGLTEDEIKIVEGGS
jgi:hypothetical protein